MLTAPALRAPQTKNGEGLNLDSAMSNRVLRSQPYSLTRNVKNPDEITFSSFIHDILRSKTATKLNE